MTIGWQKLRVPLMERLALADMALRRGQSEEELLAGLIREAVKQELTKQPDAGQPQRVEVSHV